MSKSKKQKTDKRLMLTVDNEAKAKKALRTQIKAGIDAFYKKVGVNHCIYERIEKIENEKTKGEE